MMTARLRPQARRRNGVVFPMVLILMAVLSAGAAGAFTYLTMETASTGSRQAAQDARLVAEDGLERFVHDIPTVARDSMVPASGPILVAADSSVTTVLLLSVSDTRQRQLSSTAPVPDTAEVKAYLLRRASSASDSSLWLFKVRGVAARARPAGGTKAERTIAVYAWFAPGRMNVIGGWVSLTGADRTGNAGSFSGVDACAKDTARFGIVVPNDPGAGFTGSLAGITGKGIDETRSIATLSAQLNIDWASLSTGSGITPAFVIDPSAGISSLPSAMCARFHVDTGYAPTILVKNAGGAEYNYANLCSGATKNDDKRGLLIVTGDLGMSGSSGGKWTGVLLIGERFSSNGTQDVSGVVVSGLRATVDATFRTPSVLNAESSVLKGSKQYTYDSCAVGRALRGYAGLRPMQNTYTDQWPTY